MHPNCAEDCVVTHRRWRTQPIPCAHWTSYAPLSLWMIGVHLTAPRCAQHPMREAERTGVNTKGSLVSLPTPPRIHGFDRQPERLVLSIPPVPRVRGG